jgi:hypothetical protein
MLYASDNAQCVFSDLHFRPHDNHICVLQHKFRSSNMECRSVSYADVRSFRQEVLCSKYLNINEKYIICIHLVFSVYT